MQIDGGNMVVPFVITSTSYHYGLNKSGLFTLISLLM